MFVFFKIGRITKKAIVSLHFWDTLVQLMVRAITSIFLKIKAKTSTGMSLMDMVELVPTMRKSKLYLRINKNSYKWSQIIPAIFYWSSKLMVSILLDCSWWEVVKLLLQFKSWLYFSSLALHTKYEPYKPSGTSSNRHLNDKAASNGLEWKKVLLWPGGW